ncbi:MAG: hypothetical protein PHI12_07840 [Dehalococcoidales bacterium]|jgi:hypothetical protein|nr:hypothetical protein [Dehalococcoidales bacterium]
MNPSIKVVGEDGNIFSIMGRASRALKDSGQPERATEMCDAVQQCHSYDEALAKISEYVDME